VLRVCGRLAVYLYFSSLKGKKKKEKRKEEGGVVTASSPVSPDGRPLSIGAFHDLSQQKKKKKEG